MQSLSRLCALFFLLSFIVLTLLLAPATGRDLIKKSPAVPGFCRTDTQVFEATLAECQKKRGVFFNTREEAMAKGRLMSAPLLKSSPEITPPQALPAPVGDKPAKILPKTRSVVSPASPRPPAPNPPPPAPGDTVPAPASTLTIQRTQLPGVLHLPELVDLAITSITITPVSPRIAKDIITITTTIKNIGNTTPEKDAYFQMTLSDDPYLNYLRTIVAPFGITLPRLAPNAQHVISKTVTIPRQYKNSNNQMVVVQTGNYKVHAVINSTNFTIEEEPNQANNQYTKTFILRDPPPSDLVLDSVSLTAGCRIKIEFHNAGAAIPDLDFEAAWVSAQEDDGLREQKRLSEVDAAGHSKPGMSWLPIGNSVHYTWPTPHNNPTFDIGLAPGQTSNVKVELDPYHAIRENNYSNNSRTRSLTCPQ